MYVCVCVYLFIYLKENCNILYFILIINYNIKIIFYFAYYTLVQKSSINNCYNILYIVMISYIIWYKNGVHNIHGIHIYIKYDLYLRL